MQPPSAFAMQPNSVRFPPSPGYSTPENPSSAGFPSSGPDSAYGDSILPPYAQLYNAPSPLPYGGGGPAGGHYQLSTNPPHPRSVFRVGDWM